MRVCFSSRFCIYVSQFCEHLLREDALRVAVLEDDIHVGQLISLWLERAGHSPQLFATGETFKKALSRESYDLLILDWELPDTDGGKVLAWVRQNIDWPVPVIFATARDSEEDIVTGLMAGADDYMTKPVRHNEFMARITALARRANPDVDKKDALNLPPYRIDIGARSIACDGVLLDLTQKEFDLALLLFRNPGRLLSRGYILESVWGHQPDFNTRTVDTHISRVRAKLGLTPEHGWRLNAIYNHGYRLEPAAERPE